MTSYAPDDRVMVSPRYMAGAGDRLADVLGPLIHYFGWDHRHDAATGQLALTSPDGRIDLAFDPVHPQGRWWTITHHEPHWEVVMHRQAPLEAASAVTQALPQLLGDRRHADRIPIIGQPLDEIATLHGWSVADDGTLTSPDLYCLLQHTPGEPGAWQVDHLHFEGDPLATFTQDVPPELVRNFFAHLSTSLPVERAFADIPFGARFRNGALITPVRGATVNPAVDHALARLGRPGPPGRRR